MGSTPEALEAMLNTLERNGRVRRLPTGSSCGSPSCCKCDHTTLAIFEWAGEDINNIENKAQNSEDQ